MVTLNSSSLKDTEVIAQKVARQLKGNEIIALYGGLGMGKTAFTRALCLELGCPDNISSPTFALINEYSGKFPVYHFDMYRVESWDDLYSTGFFDYIGNGVIVIEWSENIDGALPNDSIKIEIMRGKNENDRIFVIDGIENI